MATTRSRNWVAVNPVHSPSEPRYATIVCSGVRCARSARRSNTFLSASMDSFNGVVYSLNIMVLSRCPAPPRTTKAVHPAAESTACRCDSGFEPGGHENPTIKLAVPYRAATPPLHEARHKFQESVLSQPTNRCNRDEFNEGTPVLTTLAHIIYLFIFYN